MARNLDALTPLTDGEREQLADVIAFKRDALVQIERFQELDRLVSPPHEGEPPGQQRYWPGVTAEHAKQLQEQYREKRLALERALIAWGEHAPYYLFRNDARKRIPRRAPGMHARESQNVSSVPSFDALADAAVVWCMRYFDAREEGDTSEVDRRLNALGSVVHMLAHFGHIDGRGAPVRLRRAAPKVTGQMLIFYRTYGKDDWLEYVTRKEQGISEHEWNAWQVWLGVLAAEMPPAPRRGQRYRTKQAVITVAKLLGISTDAVTDARMRARKAGAAGSHVELEAAGARLRAAREARQRAGTPRPGRRRK